MRTVDLIYICLIVILSFQINISKKLYLSNNVLSKEQNPCVDEECTDCIAGFVNKHNEY